MPRGGDELSRQQETELATIRARLAHLERLAHIGTWDTDLLTHESHWSEEVFRLLGLEPHRFSPHNRDLLRFVHPADRQKVESILTRAVIGLEPYDAEYRVIRRDGVERLFRSRGEVVYLKGKAVRYYGTMEDITEQRQAEEAVRESEERLRLIAETVEEVFWTAAPGFSSFGYVSSACRRLFGRDPAQLQSHPELFFEAIHPDDRGEVEGQLRGDITGPWCRRYRIVRPDGTVRWVEDRGYPVHSPVQDRRLVGSVRDITDLKAAEQVLRETMARLAEERDRAEKAKAELARANQILEQQTLRDHLTGLANRRFLERFIEREWRRARRHRWKVSLVMIDIDFFKSFNDTYGHLQGDWCLRQVAGVLAQHLRRPTDILVRYGGEEFLAVLLETSEGAARELAEGMRRSIEALEIPHERSSVGPVLTISLGVSSVQAAMARFAQLLAKADEALYQAKNSGRNRVVVVAA